MLSRSRRICSLGRVSVLGKILEPRKIESLNWLQMFATECKELLVRPRISAPNPNKGREIAQARDENVRVSIKSNQIREREMLEVTSRSNVCNRLQKLSVLTI